MLCCFPRSFDLVRMHTLENVDARISQGPRRDVHQEDDCARTAIPSATSGGQPFIGAPTRKATGPSSRACAGIRHGARSDGYVLGDYVSLDGHYKERACQSRGHKTTHCVPPNGASLSRVG